MTWKTYEVRVTYSGQPKAGCTLPMGPEWNGDGTSTVRKSIRATSRSHALRAAMRLAANVIEAEIVEES